MAYLWLVNGHWQCSQSVRHAQQELPEIAFRRHRSSTVFNSGHGTRVRTTARGTAPVQEGSTAPLTPRQRRLAQQQRKWEEEQAQRKQKQQEAPSPPTAPSRPVDTSPSVVHANEAKRPGPPAPPPSNNATSRAGTSTGPRTRSAQPGDPTAKPVATGQPRSKVQPSSPVPPQPSPQPPHKSPTSLTASASAFGAPQPARRPDGRNPPPSLQPPAWPSLFSDSPAAATPASSLDLRSLTGEQLASLARAWAQELTNWAHQQPQQPSPASAATSMAPASGAGASSLASPSDSVGGSTSGRGTEGNAISTAGSTGGRGAAAGPPTSLPPLPPLPRVAAAWLESLAEAAEARVAEGSLGQQELADVVWGVAHYDRERAMRSLYPRMDVPFRVIPHFMPGLRLQDFMSEVELRRDVIYLDDGSRAVEESRLTGWQSDIGATFKYSGKEMQPQAGGMTPAVRQVRDALRELTGVWYDSVLINYYSDGKCGMRYHVDPLYDRWTPDQAVVSLGDTRTFIFRAIDDFNSRWLYRVRNGDLVHMFGDCQERLQHCVRVERHAADAGPRMSLVFKERLRGPTGQYLLP